MAGRGFVSSENDYPEAADFDGLSVCDESLKDCPQIRGHGAAAVGEGEEKFRRSDFDNFTSDELDACLEAYLR